MAGASLGASGVAPLYEALDDIRAAFDRQPVERLAVDGGYIRLVIADGAPGLDRALVQAWIHASARAVSTYFGRYPVPDHALLVVAEPGRHVGHATTFGEGGAVTRIRVGTEADRAAFDLDWVLVHEMVHIALPDLPRRALWLQEGNATYVEPIARALVGRLAPAEMWREAVDGIPKGLPDGGEVGMDGTRAWGRLYWGGALFWLLVEIAIYRETNGKGSLRNALRHVNRASGGNAVTWSPERLVATADAANGTGSVGRLYACFATERVAPDLAALVGELGVRGAGGGVLLDDRAPLAGLRASITTP
ncbi:hypothetical protein [Sphingomonas mali]|uniref:hypothetical protein n=1 Tax=Sphingomonas mali TaxID=40682 RepID=UPI001FE168CB|nr:hypothetical protein [Sphingomonas mali]